MGFEPSAPIFKPQPATPAPLSLVAREEAIQASIIKPIQKCGMALRFLKLKKGPRLYLKRAAFFILNKARNGVIPKKRTFVGCTKNGLYTGKGLPY